MRSLAVLIAAPALLLSGAAAKAHAMLDRAEPRVGSTVTSAPPAVSLSFTQNLEPAFSSATVTDGAGKRVDAGKPSITGNTMRVPLRPGAPGTYHVNWHVLSVDTHRTQGSFSFRVGQ